MMMRMITYRSSCFALVITALMALPVAAAEKPVAPYVQSDANAGVRPIEGEATFQAFHGQPGIARIVTRLMWFHHNDPRLSELFHSTDEERLARLLNEQFCYVLGGPCHYTGRDMKSVHAEMGAQLYQQNAQIEDLQKAMDEEKVPVWAQNRFLGRLAPLERATVTR